MQIGVEKCSWGLSLFVLFELFKDRWIKWIGSWGLSLFVLFELECQFACLIVVLED